MMLKILVPNKEKPEKVRWWVVDKIKKLSWGEIDREKVLGYSSKAIFLHPDSDKKNCLLICFGDESDNETVYAVNELTYLLNDNGKTIERIW